MINSGSRFDAIIGNPPYVKTEDIHTLETEAEFAVYKKKYKSAYKQFDKYFLFLEEAFNLLKEKKINELNIVLEQKKDKASISVIEAEKENLSKQIEDNITKIYNLQF